MAFDMGFDFRATAGFVTDPAYGVPVLVEAYPHTYTNANGNSINAGWDSTSGVAGENRASGNDPRLAGENYTAVENDRSFQVDLSSGSAPGAGTYTVDLALGDASDSCKIVAKLFDNTTVLIDLTNGGAGYSPAAGHFIDATGADVAATTSWTGTTVSKTFATTTCKLSNITGLFSGVNDKWAHFRLTLQGGGGGGAAAVQHLLNLLGVGA